MKKNTIFFLVLFIGIFSATKALAESITYYVVQVGYYKNTAIMEKDFNLIANHGLPIYKVAYDGGYRIFLGNYDTREEAEEAAKIVNEIGFETLIRTMKKKPKYIQNQSPKEKGDEKPANTTQQKIEIQPDLKEEWSLPTVKTQVPQKKDSISHTPHKFYEPDTHLDEEANIDILEEEYDRTIYYMFYSMLFIIISIGTIAAYKRNQSYKT